MMTDCKGKILSPGDIVKYRSVLSDLRSRSPKIYIAKVTDVSDPNLIRLCILKGDSDIDYLLDVELNTKLMKRGAIEKLSSAKAMLWILENYNV